MFPAWWALAASARITANPVSQHYLSQLRATNATAYGDQAVVWAMAQLGGMLEKTVTQAEIERDLARRIRDILERIDVAAQMIRSETTAILMDVDATKGRVSRAISAVREQVRQATEDMRVQTLQQIHDFAALAHSRSGKFDPSVLTRLRADLRDKVETEGPWTHHLMFAAFQVIFVAGIVYYRRLIRSLRM